MSTGEPSQASAELGFLEYLNGHGQEVRHAPQVQEEALRSTLIKLHDALTEL